MLVRFVSAEIDYQSHVSEGIFCAGYKLLEDSVLEDHDYEILDDLFDWFNLNLNTPFSYRLRSPARAPRAICWFKPTARTHLSRAWEMAGILERNDVPIRLIKTSTPGYVLYEDWYQVLAEPFADLRRALKR